MDLARGSVPEIQRARILAALVEVTRERGAARVTVAHVVKRSGVSRRTFYEFYSDRDACFLVALQGAVERGAARVAPAFREDAEMDSGAGRPASARGSWQTRVRAALLVLLEFLEEEPGLGGLCVVDALGAGPLALEYRARVVHALVDAVDEGCAEAKAGLRPTRLTAEGVVGGALAVLYARLADPSGGPAGAEGLVELLSPLMGMIVLPYLGPAAARRETARAAPKARSHPAQVRSNPLEGLEMRLTYRTVRVLAAIDALPDASNRQIADAAEIHDQGQISKLLARLQQLGLLQNTGAGSTTGKPNAWRLTARGHEVAHTIGQQTAPTR